MSAQAAPFDFMASNHFERRVVITGMGAVTPLGNDVETTWKNILAGQCGIDRITHFDATPFDTQIAGEVKNFEPVSAFPSAKEVRRSDRFAQFGVFAAHQALLDSGLDLEKVDRDEVGAFLGSGIGGLETTAEPEPRNAPTSSRSTFSRSKPESSSA